MNARIPGLARHEVRYVQRRLATLGRPFVSTDVAGDIDLCAVAATVLDADPDDEELALIARDRDEFGYLTIGHVAAVLNWVIAQEPDSFPRSAEPRRCAACHRVLTDDLSRQRGYGPVCWEKRRRGAA